MKVLIKKISSWPLSTTLFAILLFFIPFQDRYHKFLKKISRTIFHPQDLPPYFNASLSCYITDFLMLGILFFGLRQIRNQRAFFKLSLSGKFLLSFCSFVFLSLLLSENGGKIWPYYYFLQIILPILTYIVLTETIEIKNNIELFCWILCVAACLEGIIVIKQYLLQHSIGLRNLGEITQHYEFSATIYITSKLRWIFDNIFHTHAPSVKILRPAGTFPHPNVLGGFLGVVQFAIYYLIITANKKGIRWLLVAILFFHTLILSLTFSRAAIFGVIGGSCFFLGSLAYFTKMYKRILSLLVVIFISCSLTVVILHEQLQKRGGIVENNCNNIGSDSSRIYYQKTAWSMFKEHPFFGLGWNQYSLEMDNYAPEKGPPLQTVHNIYLLILAETGIFGFLAFSGFLFSIFFSLRKFPLDPISITLLSMFFFILFCGLVDHYWLLHQHGRLVFFFIPALISAYVNEKKRSLIVQNQANLILSKSQ